MYGPDEIRLADYMAGDRPTEREVKQFARDLLGYCYDHGWLEEYWHVTIDTAKTRAGVCRPYDREIGITAAWIAHADVDEIDNTVRHEAAHACDWTERGRTDHGTNWKWWGRRLGMTRVERCADVPDDMPKGKWEAHCPNCDEVVAYRWALRANMRRAQHTPCRTTVVWRELVTA
jgi:predicted SprT family Zn-dependent metalloprotease